MADSDYRNGIAGFEGWTGDDLDAALRAAFGPGGSDVGAPAGIGVLTTLDRTLGGCTRVLLRAEPGDDMPLVRPAQRGAFAEAVGARYQVLGEIARGGVGVVMHSRDVDLGRDVAMKVLRGDHVQRPSMVQRFIEEAQIAGQLQHPGILPVYELGLLNATTPFFTMKLVKGRTLAALLQQRSGPADDRERLLAVFEQVCQTLAYAHTKGVIHRDLKPSNVMVGAFGEVQVVDWGLAKVLRQGGLADERRTLAADESIVATVRTDATDAASVVGSVMGTPAYMPPEQARGHVDRLDERSDVFSLGAILCEILTGQPPYQGEHEAVLRQAADCATGDALARLAACGADEDLVSVCRRSLASDPDGRQRDAGVVAAEVSEHRASLARRARQAELAAAEASAKVVAERRARWLAVALLLGVVFGGVGAAISARGRAAREDERSARVNSAIESVAELLGAAAAAPVGQSEPWFEVRTATEQIEALLAEGEIAADTVQRAEAIVAKVHKADADRRVSERIEDVVSMGATHYDKFSWVWMEESLRDAFGEYGIDLEALSPSEAAARIRESDLAPQLADGLELWIATCANLRMFGVETMTVEELRRWTGVLDQADPDPFAAAVRKQVYADAPLHADVEALVESADFETVRPRTLSWLASACHRVNDLAMLDDIFRRAVLIYPDDFMLNFDYAFNLTYMKRWEHAIRYYHRCLALRPDSAGVWRSLGVALREIDDLEESVDALMRSIAFQPEHAPTFVELGLTYEKQGEREMAIAAFEDALALRADVGGAQEGLDRLAVETVP